MKKLNLLFLLLMSMFTCQMYLGQNFTVTTCSTGVASNTYGPMNSNTTANSKNRTAFILPASQLTALDGGTITGTYFRRLATTGSLPAGTNFKIYLKQTALTDFGSSALDWATETASATLVYDSDPATAVGSSAGFKQFVHTNNFVYTTGTSLAVFVEYSQTTAPTTSITWDYEYGTTCISTTNNNTTKYNNTTAALSATLSTSNYRRPVIAFDVTYPPAVSAPGCTTVSAPAANATGVSVTPTFTWSQIGGQNGATSYVINLGTTTGGTDILNNVDVGNLTTYSIPATSPLSYNTQYFYTIISKNAIGNATGCVERSFTTGNIPCPSVTAPINSATGVALTPSFTWGAVNGATSYTITIGTTSGGSDIVNNMSVGNVTSYTYNGSPSLSSNTIYYYTINATDGTNTSASCTVRNFTTICNAVMAPYTYDVENAANTTSSVIGNCWSSNPSGTTSAFRWDVDGAGSTPSSSTGPSGANSGVKYFYTEASSGATGAVAELYSPFINVTALTNPTLQFYYHMYGSTMGELHVDVYDGAAWINDLVVLTGQQQTAMTDPWALQIVNLSSLTITGNIQVRFRGIRGTDFYGDMSIDDISIIEAPSCLPVSNLMVDSFTSNSAMISWTAPATAPANGYEVYYSTSNVAPTATTVLDATNSATSTSTSVTIPSLTSNTAYYLWVRSACNATDKSDWVGPVNGFTGYCQPSTTNQNSWISAFTSTGAITNINYSSATGAVGGYQNLSATQKISNFEGSVTPISITAGGPTVGVSIWIDWNNNLIFEASEKVYGTTSYSTTATGNITVPTGTALGNYRMRAVVNYNNSAPSNPCDVFTRGEYIDYTFEVVQVPACVPPTGVSPSAITDVTATLSWTASSSAPNSYEYVYSTTNTTPSSGTSISATSVDLSTLSPSTTYYYWVRSNCGGSTSTWVSGSFTTLATPPANDNCSGAVSLTPGATFAQNMITATNAGATSDGTAQSCQTNAVNNVWYSVVVPPSGSLTIETKAAVGSQYTDSVINVFSGTCGSLINVTGGCDDDGGDGAFSKVILTGQTPGSTLLVSVWRWGGSTVFDGTFQISAYDASLSTSEAVVTKNEIKAYPNPFSDVLNISDIKNVKSISVIDIAGRVVKSFDKPTATLQLSELNSGMYLVVLNMNDGTKQTLKAIKK